MDDGATGPGDDGDGERDDVGTGGDAAADPLAALAARDGWQVEGYAARVHYRGAGDHYSVEYYAPSDCVLYWKVDPETDRAVPVARESVPDPLRSRIREDLAAAGVDAETERRRV
jgi:hypothetical protein